MADTYEVLPKDVAAELPGIFPAGFTATSMPSESQVASAISTADTLITLQVEDLVGQAPDVSDRAAPLAVRYIVEWVKAWVIRVAYAGRDPAQVNAVASPYDVLAKQMWDALIALGAQAEGTGESSPRVMTSVDGVALPVRDLVVDTIDLDARSGFRGRW